MWAQLIKMRVKPERAGEVSSLFDDLSSFEQPGSGLVRSMAMQDQKDPLQTYVLVVFESEEVARAREGDPRRQEALKGVQARMMEVFDGPPEFVDMMVLQSLEN